MVKITFINSDGQKEVVTASVGMNLMEVAKANNIEDVVAECGGACACATCHVYIGDEWFEKLDPKSEIEESMLMCSENVLPTSRLSCQVVVTELLDGMWLKVADNN